MRTNGFALFRGPGCLVSADRATRRVRRYCRELAFGSGHWFESWSDRAAAGDQCLLAYALDESRGLPLVHGFVGGKTDEGRATGECSLLARVGEVLVASRDRLGTRALYVDQTGSCIASDHRFFQETPRLLPNGARLRTDSMEMTTSTLSTGGTWSSLDECAAELVAVLTEAVATRVRGRKKVAVSFSGGLDSSLIALIAAKETEVLLCSAYAPGSRDQRITKAAADSLGLELDGVEMDRASAARELQVLDLPFEPTAMDKALWCIYSATAREAAGRGAELIMLGQLADELFGGYMKYARMGQENEEGAAAMMRADVAASGDRAFIRDEQACARFTEVRFPFADERLAAFALGVPVGYKIAKGERKVVLRRAASMLGLPEALAAAPKKAAEYSSGVAKLAPERNA